MVKDDLLLLKSFGWEVLSETPFVIRNRNTNSFASLDAAELILDTYRNKVLHLCPSLIIKMCLDCNTEYERVDGRGTAGTSHGYCDTCADKKRKESADELPERAGTKEGAITASETIDYF